MSEKVDASFLNVADLKELTKGIYELEITSSNLKLSKAGNPMYEWQLQPTDPQSHSFKWNVIGSQLEELKGE